MYISLNLSLLQVGGVGKIFCCDTESGKWMQERERMRDRRGEKVRLAFREGALHERVRVREREVWMPGQLAAAYLAADGGPGGFIGFELFIWFVIWFLLTHTFDCSHSESQCFYTCYQYLIIKNKIWHLIWLLPLLREITCRQFVLRTFSFFFFYRSSTRSPYRYIQEGRTAGMNYTGICLARKLGLENPSPTMGMRDFCPRERWENFSFTHQIHV